jgi:hypothetical protein
MIKFVLSSNQYTEVFQITIKLFHQRQTNNAFDMLFYSNFNMFYGLSGFFIFYYYFFNLIFIYLEVEIRLIHCFGIPIQLTISKV